MRLMILVALLGLSIHLFAALPPDQEIQMEALKFSISEAGTTWELTPPPPESSTVKILFRGKARGNVQPTLTVRIENLQKEEKDLKDYMKRWLREYPKFGYSVLGSKPFTLDGKPAFVVDLVSSTSGKQARQVLTEKNREVALLTCLDNQAEFATSLTSCNSIIRSFKWK